LDKVTHIRATQAQRLVSQDCGCLMNIGGAMAKQGEPIPSQHIAEFLWERTRGKQA
jgi:L-lactate dehydrogenase complex protein LldE